MSEFETSETDKLLSNIEPIEHDSMAWIAKETDIDKYIEEPLKDAVKILMKKGIETVASSANRKNLKNGKVGITINWDSLSQENKDILNNKNYISEIEEFGNFKKINSIELKTFVSQSTTNKEIIMKFEEIIKDFKKQNPFWIPEYTLEDLLQEHNITKQEYEIDKDCFEKIGYYFDKETKKFYQGDWHCKIKRDLREYSF